MVLALRVMVLVALAQAKPLEADGGAARLLVETNLVDRLARAALPLSVDLSAGQRSGRASAILIDVRYCGADARGRGRALTVWSATVGEGAAILRAPDDCRAPLAALAERGRSALGGKPVAVAELATSVRAGTLSFAVEKAVLAGDMGGAAAEGLRALAGRPALPAVPTSGLTFGRTSSVPALSLAADWRSSGVALAVSPGPRAPSPAGGPAGAPKDGMSAEIPLAVVNVLIDAAARREPFRVRLDPEEVELTEVRVARAGTGLVVTGRATPRSVAEPFNVAVELNGSDLQVVEVQVRAQLEDCSTQGLVERLGCRARNAGRDAAAQAFAAGLRQEYRGRLVRQLVGPQRLSLDLAGRRVSLQAELSRLSVSDASLRAEAAVTVN